MLVNTTTGTKIAEQAEVLVTFAGRLIGVMGRALPPGQAVGITACDWVHTFFVRCPLDLLYCDRAGNVLSVVSNFPAYRIGPRVPGAYIVWELRGGTLKDRPVAVAHRVMVQD